MLNVNFWQDFLKIISNIQVKNIETGFHVEGVLTITIDDIARLANVSKATVSKVINGYPGVNQKTRKIVLSIMRKYNYWPNATARSLTTNRSYLIGLFVASELNNSFFREVIAGIEKKLGNLGYDILYFANKRPDNTGIHYGYLEKCLNRHVDGAIMLSYIRNELADFDSLLCSNIPQVYVDLDLQSDYASYIISNNQKSAETAVSYLHSLGHKKIGYLDGTKLSKPAADRYQGFCTTIKKLDLITRPEWICHGEFTEEYGYQTMLQLLQLPDLPTAWIIQDNIAIGAIHAFRKLGYQIPNDFSIIGFDDIELSRHYDLTTVRQDKLKMGKAAAELLLNILNGHNKSPIILDTQLIVRGSCQISM